MEAPTTDVKCNIDAVFGNAVLLINESMPVKVEMDAVFGQVAAPGKNVAGFGESTYTTPSYDPNKPALIIKADAVFGKIDIQSRKW
jgi:hypothetical protein